MKCTYQWDTPEEPFEYLHNWIVDPWKYEEYVAAGAWDHIADRYEKLQEKPHPLPSAFAAVEEAALGGSSRNTNAALNGIHLIRVACLEGVQAMLRGYQYWRWFEPRPKRQWKKR